MLNLCDGTELDGFPGLSITKKLHERKIPYTGASPKFYFITDSKICQKKILI